MVIRNRIAQRKSMKDGSSGERPALPDEFLRLENSAAKEPVPAELAAAAATQHLVVHDPSHKFTPAGLKQGEPGYEKLVARIHDVTLAHKIALGGPQAWKNRQGFNFFQAPGETAILRMGAQVNLGINPKPEVCPGVAPIEGTEKNKTAIP